MDDKPDNNDPRSEAMRLSEAERRHALEVLGTHYADGRLDDTDFDARIRIVSGARALGDLHPAYDDLPGGVPLQMSASGQILPTADAAPAPARESMDEVELLRHRGAIIERIDWIAVPVTLVAFLVLQLIVGWSFAWILWPIMAVVLVASRAVLRFSDDDEDTYEELKEADKRARKERIQKAAQRIRDIEEQS